MNFKVHIFWEGHKILPNLHQLFVLCTASQIIGGDLAKFCGLLRIYELYRFKVQSSCISHKNNLHGLGKLFENSSNKVGTDKSRCKKPFLNRAMFNLKKYLCSKAKNDSKKKIIWFANWEWRFCCITYSWEYIDLRICAI